MKNSGKTPNPKVLTIFLSISILLILILIVLYKFGIKSNQTAKTVVEDEIATEVEAFSSQIYEDLDNMTRMGIAFRDMIAAISIKKPIDALPFIGTLCDNSEAYMVVYCDADGTGVTQNGIKVNVGDDYLLPSDQVKNPYYAYIQKERIMQAEAVVSVIPVTKKGIVNNYILMYYSVSRIKKLFNENKAFDNSYFIFSVDHGIVITTEGMKEKPKKGTAIIQILKDMKIEINLEQLRSAMENKESIAAFTAYEDHKYVICSPVGINDWYITIGFDKTLYDNLLEKEWGSMRNLINYLLALIITFVIITIGIMFLMGIIFKNTNKKLQKQAAIDSLTGLYNKMATENIIKQYMRDYPKAAAILFVLDIDDFKKINDNLGHAEGDAVLKRVGYYLKEINNDDHVVGRIGGDEFIIFAKNIDNERKLTEQMQKMKEYLQVLPRTESTAQPCTFSIGAALYPKDAEDFENLYKAADRALYAAKKNGKNQLKTIS